MAIQCRTGWRSCYLRCLAAHLLHLTVYQLLMQDAALLLDLGQVHLQTLILCFERFHALVQRVHGRKLPLPHPSCRLPAGLPPALHSHDTCGLWT